jgi:hypothetical protein
MLEARGAKCTVVDEPYLLLQRDAAYKGWNACMMHAEECSESKHRPVSQAVHATAPLLPDIPSEKNTRALLKSTLERMVSQKDVTILDSLNNIKVRARTGSVSFLKACMCVHVLH